MAWLYIPDSKESHCAADMEGLNWALKESFQDQEPFVMWRGNVLQPNTLSKKWKKVPWMMRLSGLMLKPSTASLGVEKWIGSLEDSHANPIQRLENKWGKQIPGTYGPILSESLGRCDQDSYSLRMFQMSLECDLIPLSLTSINWGIMLHGVLWRLRTLEPCIEEGDGSSWESNMMIPKPNAADGMRTNNHHHRGNLTLKGYAQLWPTPTASEAQKAGNYSKGQMGQSLTAMTKQGKLIPTPTTQGNASVAGQYDKNTGTTLAGFVKTFPTPIAREANEAGGSMERHRRLNREKETLTRAISGEENLTQCGKLNPQWVAWLMGLPIGWINYEY